jgi:hypothetical protein
MKKRSFLYLLLLLNERADSRQFQKALNFKKIIEKTDNGTTLTKRDLKSEPTFNFPIECSIENGYHQTTWLGAAQNVEGAEAEYSISCARHQTIEGNHGEYEVALVINPRAPKRAHIFTSKTHALNAENPLHGKACKIMAEYNTSPLIVLKDSPNDLYYFSEILLAKNSEQDDVVSLSRYSFDKEEIIHHVAAHQDNIYVFHSKGEFGANDTARITVLHIFLDPVEIVEGTKKKIENGKEVLDENGKPVMEDDKRQFARHVMSIIASQKIKKYNAAFVGEGGLPLLKFGSEIKTVEFDNKLFAAFSVTPAHGAFASGLVQISLKEIPKLDPVMVRKSNELIEKCIKKAPKAIALMKNKLPILKQSVAEIILKYNTKPVEEIESQGEVQDNMQPQISDQSEIESQIEFQDKSEVESQVEEKTISEEAHDFQASEEILVKESYQIESALPKLTGKIEKELEQVDKQFFEKGPEQIASLEESIVSSESDALATTAKVEDAKSQPAKPIKNLPSIQLNMSLIENALKYDVVFTSVILDKSEIAGLPFCSGHGNAVVPKKLVSMSTSTGSQYLVYVFNNQITALPIDKNGKIILKGAVEDFYSSGNFIQRTHKRGGDHSLISSLKLFHEIKNIQIVGDTIYIQDTFNQEVYSYRALFDENGAIYDWCASERFEGNEGENIRLVSGQKAYSWYGICQDSSYSFNQMLWETSTRSMAEFVEAVNQSLPQHCSGVQGFVSLTCNTLYQPRHLIAATGYQHAVFGFVMEDKFKMVDPQVIAIPEAGALVTAAIIGSMENEQEWLLLGGVGGLYGYAANDGSGFKVVERIDDIFTPERSWNKIGNFSFVKKIVKDKNNHEIAYIVTTQGVYKIFADKNMFTHPRIEKIFDSAILGGRFDYVSDIIVDEEFAIVGTSKGLFVIEDMTKATNPYALELDGRVGSVAQITAVKGSKKFDNVYVLTNNNRSQTSSVYRIVVRDKKCTLFPDCVNQYGEPNQGIRGAFLNMESSCSAFFSNGSWNVRMNYPYKDEQRAIMCYNSHIRSGVDTIRTANRNNLNSMYLSCVKGSQNIAGMQHDPVLGCWVIFGDFGLRILS